MKINLDDKGYGTRKPEDGRSYRRKVFFCGTLLLVALAAWLSWRAWQQWVQLKPLPLAGNKIIRAIPSPAPSQGTKSRASLKTGSKAPRTIPLADVQGGRDSTTESSYPEQGNDRRETFATEDATSRPAQEEFVIQLGAFRRLAGAENLQKGLKDKGYDAYLDARTLPKLGLVHRVRIRGYPSVAAAKADMERLHKEEGLSSIILNIGPNPTPVSEK